MSMAVDLIAGDRTCFPRVPVAMAACSSSSIGRNSDAAAAAVASCGATEVGEEEEVQSRFKSPLETMDELQDCLPIRRGISSLYSGKSKSFTDLADVEVSSRCAKDLCKPETAYTRKRKNLLAFSAMWVHPDNTLLESTGSTPKKLATSSRSVSSLACSTSSSGSNGTCSEEEEDEPARFNSPLCPLGKTAAAFPRSFPKHKKIFPWRSFSLVDLHRVASPRTSLARVLRTRGRRNRDLLR